jgi:hypothetical protein
MRRLVMLGIAVLAGCGSGAGPLEGFWRANEAHAVSFTGDRYEAQDRDAVGLCRSAGDYLVAGTTVQLHLDSASCAGAPDGLTVDGDRLIGGERVYVRANPAIRYLPAPVPAP